MKRRVFEIVTLEVGSRDPARVPPKLTQCEQEEP
jgi:hypothetical protein